MSMTLNDVMQQLNIRVVPDYFYDFYDEIMADFDANKLECISEAFLKRLKDEYDILPLHYDLIQDVAARTRANEALARYCALLCRMIHDRDHKDDIGSLDFPKASREEDQEPFRMVSIYACFAYVENSIRYLRSRGVDEDIIIETMRSFDSILDIYYGKWHYFGYNETYFAWSQHYLNCDILRIGCLNFEIAQSFKGGVRAYRNKAGEYKLLAHDIDLHVSGQRLGSIGCEDEEGSFHAEIIETDEYYEGYPSDTLNSIIIKEKVRLCKSEWEEVIREGDQFISVHIPRGEKIDREHTTAAYTRCREVLSRCFPEFKPKAFACYSWLMEPRLALLLKPTSNILSFQSKFMRFPLVSQGRGVFGFLFTDQSIKRLEDLPENTSLERAAKKYLLEGNHLFEQGGVFFEI